MNLYHCTFHDYVSLYITVPSTIVTCIHVTIHVYNVQYMYIKTFIIMGLLVLVIIWKYGIKLKQGSFHIEPANGLIFDLLYLLIHGILYIVPAILRCRSSPMSMAMPFPYLAGTVLSSVVTRRS